MDAIGEVERTQTLIERGPLSALLAMSLLAVATLFFLLMRERKFLVAEKDRSREELQKLYEKSTARHEVLNQALFQLTELIEPLRLLAYEVQARRHRAEHRKKGDTPTKEGGTDDDTGGSESR